MSDTDSSRSSNRSFGQSCREQPYSLHSKSGSSWKDDHCSSLCSWMESSKPKDITLEHLPKMLKPVNTGLKDVLIFRSTLLINRNQCYNHFVAKSIAKITKLIRVQMCHLTFDPAYLIYVLYFLSTSRTTYNSDGMSEGSAMRLFQFFICHLTALIISTLTSFVTRPIHCGRGTFLVLRRREISTGYICHRRHYCRSSA